jgi:hypothetical protein
VVPVAGQPGAGRLEVRFAPAWLSWLPMVWGDYWILKLDRDYQVALVGTPDREYLWVLSRAPRLDDAALQAELDYAAQPGLRRRQGGADRQVARELRRQRMSGAVQWMACQPKARAASTLAAESSMNTVSAGRAHGAPPALRRFHDPV